MTNLNLNWTGIVPSPNCGYKAEYRRNADTLYTEIDVSGSTNSLSVAVVAPACFEGKVISDCCSDNLSEGTAFGVNGSSPFHVAITLDPDTFNIIVTTTSTFANPYDLLLRGQYDLTVSAVTTTHAFSVSYPAGSTSSSSSVLASVQGATISNIIVSGYSPVFNNGGELQQLDPVNTPSYFRFYWDGSSGTTFYSPLLLPSFLIEQFDTTEVDGSGNVLAGNLHISYIVSGTDFTALFDTISFQVTDGVHGTMGSVSVDILPNGLRQAIIPLVKVFNPILRTTQFTMKAIWPDLSVADTAVFYFP